MINTTYILPSTVANISCATCVSSSTYIQQEIKTVGKDVFLCWFEKPKLHATLSNHKNIILCFLESILWHLL